MLKAFRVNRFVEKVKINGNEASGKENNVSKSLPLHFISLLIVPILKNNHYRDEINFTFLKNVLDQISKAFNTKSVPQLKDWKSSYQRKQILSPLLTLMLD